MQKDIKAINEAYESVSKGSSDIAMDGDKFLLPDGRVVQYKSEQVDEEDDRYVNHSLVDDKTGKTFAILNSDGKNILTRGAASKSEIQRRLNALDLNKMNSNNTLTPNI